MRPRLGIPGLLGSSLLLAVGAGPAGAIEISNVLVAFESSNSPDELLANPNSWREFDHNLVVHDGGGTAADSVSASVDARTRLSSVLINDTNNTTQSDWALRASDYSVTFTVSAGPSVVYDLQIDTQLQGLLSIIDDNGGYGTAAIGTVSATVDSNSAPGLGTALDHSLFNLQNSTTTLPFNDLGVLLLSGLSGGHTYVLRFTWQQIAKSGRTDTGGVFGEPYPYDGPHDEAAMLLGLNGATGSSGYPSVGQYGTYPSRNPADDGHFVKLTATVTSVPEAGTLLYVILGLAALAIRNAR